MKTLFIHYLSLIHCLFTSYQFTNATRRAIHHSGA